MKKTHFYHLALSLIFLTACKKNVLEEPQVALKPNSISAINTITGVNGCFNWETNPYITLTNGESRILPWRPGATTQIPSFILNDYKKEEG